MSIKSHGNWMQAKTEEQAIAYIEACLKAPRYGFDIENHGGVPFDPYTNEITGFSLSAHTQEAMYFPLAHTQAGVNLKREPIYNALRPLLLNGKGRAHHFKYEYKFMKVKLNVEFKLGVCTMVLAFLDDPNRTWSSDPRSLNLKDLVMELYGIDTPHFNDVLAMYNAENFSQIPMEAAVPYGCGDADWALRLDDSFYNRVKTSQPQILELELSLIPEVAAQELRGVFIDPTQLTDSEEIIDEEIIALKLECFELMGFTPEKNSQGEYLWPFELKSGAKFSDHIFNVMGIPREGLSVGKDGRILVNKKAMAPIRKKYPVIDVYLKFKEAFHMKNNFLGSLVEYQNPVTGFIHGSANTCGAPTGRFAHSNPNLAQLPKKRE